jgi:hypothetical protein
MVVECCRELNKNNPNLWNHRFFSLERNKNLSCSKLDLCTNLLQLFPVIRFRCYHGLLSVMFQYHLFFLRTNYAKSMIDCNNADQAISLVQVVQVYIIRATSYFESEH